MISTATYPLRDLPNQEGFRFTGVDKDWIGHDCIVVKDALGCHNVKRLSDGEPFFMQLIGWRKSLPDKAMSIETERQIFLEYVGAYIKEDPETAAHISDYIQAGLRAALNETRQRAADMESLLAISLTSKRRKWSGDDVFVRKTLEKWAGKTCLNWKWMTE